MNCFNYTCSFLILLSFSCSSKGTNTNNSSDSTKKITIKITNNNANLRPRPEPEDNFKQSELCAIPLDTILVLKLLENVSDNKNYLKIILNEDEANKYCKNKDTWYIYKSSYEELNDNSKMADDKTQDTSNIGLTKAENKCKVTQAVIWNVKNLSPILYEDSTKNLVKDVYADIWFVDVFIAVMKELKEQLKIKGVIHWGMFNCRNVAGTNSWSMHAYGLAIDIKSIIMSDGTEANVEKHWNERGKKEDILKKADQIFAKYFDEKLNPNSNEAHKDHFHLGLYPKNRPKAYKYVNYPVSLSLYEEQIKPIFFMQIENGSFYHNGE